VDEKIIKIIKKTVRATNAVPKNPISQNDMIKDILPLMNLLQ
jgi:hypothetical protein